MKYIDSIPAAEKKRIKKAVEAAFEKYRLCKYVTYKERIAKITANYELRGGTGTIAIHNVDGQAACRAYCEQVERAVNQLPQKERQLITTRYLDPDADYIRDYQIYRDVMQISEGTYTKIRNSAFTKLAVTLGIVQKGGKKHAE
jgi:ArpU family phage transcriptional regulator